MAESKGFDLGQFLGEIMKAELAKKAASLPEAPKEESRASEEVMMRVQRGEELSRRWYLTTAINLMSDEKNSEGMNYSWQDIVIIAEKVRAYIEGGVFVDTGYAWQGVPKMTESPTETLGN